MARSTTSVRIGGSGLSPDVVRVFVSYTHDSPTHKRRVLEYAEELRDGGIDCELDQYEEAPPEGWPAWMAKQVRLAKYVLVVCTAAYHRRITGAERPGVGLGARWEGALITQDLYERGGQNDKFIPVIFEPGDLNEIPDFLRHTTRYDLSDATQRERLYRRLTDQPLVTRRPLGAVRRLPKDHPPEPKAIPSAAQKQRRAKPDKEATGATGVTSRGRSSSPSRASHPVQSISLIREPTGPSYFIPLVSVEVRGEETTAVLQPAGGPERAFLEDLANRRFGLPTVDFVFGKTAMRCRLSSVVRAFERGTDRFTLVLGADARHDGNSMEMSTGGLSADDIARLRARRILLDEALSTPPGHTTRGFGEDTMLESLVRGLQSSVQVERSPLPALTRIMGVTDKRRFLSAAELTAILWLRLTGTVAQVFELDIKFKGGNAVAVRFRGTRARVYTNKEPEIIAVDGVCPLG